MGRRVLIAVAALVILLPACASDADEASVVADSDVAADEPAGDEAPVSDDNNDDGGAGDFGGRTAEFCTATLKVEDAFASFGLGLAPEQLQATIDEALTAMDTAIELAPDEIRSDVVTSAESFGLVAAEFERANYNVLDVDLGALDAIASDPKFEAADENLDAFFFNVCNQGDDPALDEDEDEDDSIGDGTLRDQLITSLVATGFTEEEAECITENIDVLGDDLQDPEQLFALITTCGISPERLGQLGS